MMADNLKLDDLVPISLEIMRLDKVPGFDLYLMGEKGPVLYRERNVRFTRHNLHSLLENNVQFLYFKRDDEDNYYQYIEDNLDRIVEDVQVPRNKKASVAYDTSAHLAHQMMVEPESGQLVKRAARVIDSIVTFTSKDKAAYKDIIQILPRDYYTHTHCANVATYSLALGRLMGLTVSSGLWELTLGALLHDIGKSKVPPEILNKKGRLTEEEFEIVKKHVEWGAEIAGKASAVPKDSYPAIWQHHERLCGTGYPAGITDLHLFGRIVAVADTFDAITTNRPYERRRSSFEALSVIQAKKGEFDHGVLMALIEVMAARECRLKISV